MNADAKSQLATREQHEVAQYTGEAGSIMEVIARIAQDPNADVEKFERLVALSERMDEKRAERAYNTALAQMQPSLPVIDERGGIKDKNGKVQSTYAKWEDINDAIRPILHEYGFGLSFRIGQGEGLITVTGVLSHEGGHSEATTISLPSDTSGSKNAVQAVGSSTSYGKRYTALALLNITSRAKSDRDDDGHGAGLVTITDEQVAELRKLCQDFDANEQRLAQNTVKVNRLEDIPAKDFARVKQALNDWARAQRRA